MTGEAMVRLALWLVESGRRTGEERRAAERREAFAGDLLEGVAAGAGAWWCLGQAMRWRADRGRARAGETVLFAAGFVLLYPAWQRCCRAVAEAAGVTQDASAAWPGGAVRAVGVGLLPAMLFVSAGVVVYLGVRRAAWRWPRVLTACSVGWSVVLAATVVRLRWDAEPELAVLGRPDFLFPVLPGIFSGLVFAGLVAAVLVLGPGRRGRA